MIFCVVALLMKHLLFAPPGVLSLREPKTKQCIHCKYFLEDDGFSKYGIFKKCSLFPKEKANNDYHLIHDGIEQYTGYLDCSTTREDESMCGKEGKRYIRKYAKKGN